MKKFLLIIVLSVLSLCSFAQGQEDHVVRRGRYKAAVTQEVVRPQKHWFSNISTSIVFGKYNVANCNIDYKPALIYSNNYYKNHQSLHDEEEVVLSASYELLYRIKTFYIGPAIVIASGKDFSPGAYIRARYEIGPWDYRPYISAAFGVYYFSGNGSYNNSYWARYTKYSNSGTRRYYSCGLDNSNEASVSGGIKKYLDFSIGFSINFTENFSIKLGYQAILRPSVNLIFDINKYKYEIDEFIRTHNNASYVEQTWSFPVQTKEVNRFYHGFIVSFQF